VARINEIFSSSRLLSPVTIGGWPEPCPIGETIPDNSWSLDASFGKMYNISVNEDFRSKMRLSFSMNAENENHHELNQDRWFATTDIPRSIESTSES